MIEEPVIKQPELRDITKLIDTYADVPVWSPDNLQQQIQIVTSGATSSLYVYDAKNNKWLNVALVNGSL